MTERPKVGLGVVVVREGKVLLGERIGAHGAHTWCFPGGHLEFGETWEQCAARETLEECGLVLSGSRHVVTTNDVFLDEGKHYVTIYMLAEAAVGEPQRTEPDKFASWAWFDWDHLPEPLFLPMQHLIASGFRPPVTPSITMPVKDPVVQ